MQVADFQKTWADLMGEKESLVELRTNLENELIEVNNKISHIEEILHHLAPLAGHPFHSVRSVTTLGLTDAIRTVLMETRERMSAGDIRKKLEGLNYNLSGLTAPMASIYKVLGRIVSQDPSHFERIEDEGKVYFRWTGYTDEEIPF